MALTYTAIQTVTLASNQAAIEFTSIPSTYTDLYILLSGRGTRSGNNDFPVVSFNSVTANRFSRYLSGTTNYQGGFQETTTIYGYQASASNAANTFGVMTLYIPQYLDSNNKQMIIDSVVPNTAIAQDQWVITMVSGQWSNSSAITSVKLTPLGAPTDLMGTNSTATLYGIKKA